MTTAGPVLVIDRSAHSAPPLTPGIAEGATAAVLPTLPGVDP